MSLSATASWTCYCRWVWAWSLSQRPRSISPIVITYDYWPSCGRWDGPSLLSHHPRHSLLTERWLQRCLHSLLIHSYRRRCSSLVIYLSRLGHLLKIVWPLEAMQPSMESYESPTATFRSTFEHIVGVPFPYWSPKCSRITASRYQSVLYQRHATHRTIPRCIDVSTELTCHSGAIHTFHLARLASS